MLNAFHFPPSPKQRYPGEVGRNLSRNPLAALTKIAAQCGDIAYFKLGRSHMFFINSPDYIREVLVTKQRHFIKSDGTRVAKSIMGEGILTSEGDFHRRNRKIVQSGFRHERIASYAGIIVDITRRASESWTNNQVIDIEAEMIKLSLAIVAKSLFNTDVNVDSDAAFLSSLESVHRIKESRANRLRAFWQSNRDDVEHSRKALDSMIYDMINERRKSGIDHGDLLSTLLQARDSEGAGVSMSDLQVRDEIMTLFLAAHETTAMALTWTWYMLSQNPDVEQKVCSEIEAYWGSNHPSAANPSRLGYVDQVLTESLRMYPPAWLTGRKALTDVEIGGYVLPAGSNIIISQFHMHHDRRYFHQPESFSPDRWTPEFRNSLPKFAYFPFGGGPRTCIGEPLVWMETPLIIATIARRWRLQDVTGQHVQPFAMMSLPPAYILVRPLRPSTRIRMRCTERNLKNGQAG